MYYARPRWVAALPLLSLLALTGAPVALGQTQTPAGGAWTTLRPQYYGEREIGVVDQAFISLDAPASTPDPSATPLTVRFSRKVIRALESTSFALDSAMSGRESSGTPRRSAMTIA